jgi:hypothetical protein
MLILLFGFACLPVVGQAAALTLLIVLEFGRPILTFKCLATGATVGLITLSHEQISSGGSVLINALKWILLFAACARCLVAEGKPTRSYGRLFNYWALLTGILIINSLFVSAFRGISAFKTISFSLGLLCVLRLAMLTTGKIGEMLLFISEIGTAVVILSVPLLPLEVGWAQTQGLSFNGILIHPQTFGIFLVMTGAASFAAAFRFPGLRGFLMLCGSAQFSMIFFTRARTALVALLLGGLVYVVEFLFRGEKSTRIRFVSPAVIILVVLGITIATISVPTIREGFAAFVRKGDTQSLSTAEDRAEALRTGSRGRQILDVLDLIEQHPIFGFGFGVDPNSEKNMGANGAQLFGVPLSAPVEQGFLPIATLAQIGIVGSLFVLPLVFSMYGYARRGSAEEAALFIAVLGVNFGEMIFYSLGGVGLVMWIVLVLMAVNGAAAREYPGVPIR